MNGIHGTGCNSLSRDREEVACHRRAERGHRDADLRSAFAAFISSTDIALAGTAMMPLSPLMHRLAGVLDNARFHGSRRIRFDRQWQVRAGCALPEES